MSDHSNSNRAQPQQQPPPPSACQQPLIQLLDGVLAQSERRVNIAVTEITNILLAHSGTVVQLPHPEMSMLNSVTNLHCLLQTLLTKLPEYASYPSQRCWSFPLHFAASIGNIQVASLLMSKVRSYYRFIIVIVIAGKQLQS